MVPLLKRLSKSPIYRIVAAQFIATITTASLLSVFNPIAGYSALAGGLVCVVPGIYLLAQSLKQDVDRSGMRAAIWAEAGKYTITIAMCIVVFTQIKPLNVLAFFATFAGFQFFYLLVPLVDAMKLRRRG